jgi:predicted NBD/HSP70 family sugar kinase
MAADVRPDCVRAVLTDLDTRIRSDVTVPLNPGLSSAELVDRIVVCCSAVMPQDSDSRSRVVGLGLSLPGTVHPDTLELEFAPNLGLRNTSFAVLADRLALPVWIDNEANLAALAELHVGGHGDLRHLLYVSVTQGIGVGVVMDGRLYRGSSGKAGEFGHMTIVAGGRQCSCGRRGCWERYASISALVQEYHEHGGSSPVREFEEFIEALRGEEPAATAAFERFTDGLVTGILNLAVGLDPDRIVVGGRIAGFADCPPIAGGVQAALEKGISGFDVVISRLGDDASIRGAALLPRNTVITSGQPLPLL